MVEILLFPWINSGFGIELLFYLLLLINIFFGIIKARIKVGYFSKIDLLLSGFISFILLNPNTYWEPIGVSAVYVRIIVFFLRYILIRDYSFTEIINTFSLGVLISSLSAIFLWQYGYGDQWRLNFPYGDPNYQGFIFVSYGMFIILLKDYWKGSGLIPIIAIISCVLVSLLGASRGTAVSLILVLIIFLIRRVSLLKLVPASLMVIFLLNFGLKNIDMFGKITLVERMLNPRTSDAGAANSRLVEINAAFKEYKEQPQFAFFGFGLSRSASKETNFFNSRFRIHNTPVAIFFDTGLIGFALCVILFGSILQKVWYDSRIYLLIFIILNSLTFFVFTFYHFYICLLFLRSQRLE